MLALGLLLLAAHIPRNCNGLLLLTYPGAICASVVAYRLSPHHPLSGYPGPLLARVSKFWAVWNTWRGKQHHVVMELHRRYGNYVRIGEQFPLDLESNRDIMLTWTQVQMIFQSLMSTRFPRCLGRMGCPRANVCDHCTLTVKDYAQFSEILRVFGSAGSTRTEQSLYTDRRGARESTPSLEPRNEQRESDRLRAHDCEAITRACRVPQILSKIREY